LLVVLVCVFTATAINPEEKHGKKN
jgi:hypothetical protein